MAWLRDTLARDNEVWLGRDTELLAGKYRKMAADPFDFVRGTSALFYADLARPEVERSSTTFLSDPDAASVLLAGDPHPENVGTTLPGEEPDGGVATEAEDVRLEVQDLDGSSFGPWLLDVRRGALGLAVLADHLDGCGSACSDATISAFATAYATRMDTDPAGAGVVSCSDDRGAVVDALCATTLGDGPGMKVLDAVTTGEGRGRHFVLDPRPDDAGKGVLALTATEDAQLDRLLAAWTRRPEDFRELDRARRYGVGVASFPAIRYVVIWDHGDAGPGDDHLLSVREVIDPPSPPARGPTVPVLFDSNAARIEEVAWMLWSRPDVDARMAGLADGATTFKVTTWSSWVAGFDHDDIADAWAAGDVDEAALAGFAATVGDILAASHARGLTAEGAPAGAVIAADLAGRTDALVAELLDDAATDLERSTADHTLFEDALDAYGPLLGAETLATDLPR